MPGHAVTVLGGLPVFAEVWFSGPDYQGEYDAGVNGLFWLKADGSKGSPLSAKMMDRIERKDPYWQADVTERVSEQLAYEQDLEKEDGRLTLCLD